MAAPTISPTVQANSQDLAKELNWFRQILDTRLKLYSGQDADHNSIYDINPPDLTASTSNWAQFIQDNNMEVAERLAILLALVAKIAPQLLDVLWVKNTQFGRPFTEFGGLRDAAQKGFTPTLETLYFLLAGRDLSLRLELAKMLLPSAFLIKEGVLKLQSISDHPSPLNQVLYISEEHLARFTHGEELTQSFRKGFPAELLSTSLNRANLFLSPRTLDSLDEISRWMVHGQSLREDFQMEGKFRPGYRALFYGGPGTGKRLAATILGNEGGQKVYRLELAMLISKSTTAAEQMVTQVFQEAERNNWILFIEEADIIMKKHSTNMLDEAYPSPEIAFLQQRIERFDGLIILTSNITEDIDDRFTSQFDGVVFFPMPRTSDRQQLWNQGLPTGLNWGADVIISNIASSNDLSGGSIMNVIRFASLVTLERGSTEITEQSILQGIRLEKRKLGEETA